MYEKAAFLSLCFCALYNVYGAQSAGNCAIQSNFHELRQMPTWYKSQFKEFYLEKKIFNVWNEYLVWANRGLWRIVPISEQFFQINQRKRSSTKSVFPVLTFTWHLPVPNSDKRWGADIHSIFINKHQTMIKTCHYWQWGWFHRNASLERFQFIKFSWRPKQTMQRKWG